MSEPGNNSGDEPKRNKRPIVPKSAREALRPEKVPQPTAKHSRRAKSQLVIFLNFLMSIAVLACICGVGVYFYASSTYREAGPLKANATFTVRSGAGLAEISMALQRNGVVSDSRVFRYVTAARFRDGETLKAGDYEIKAGSSMEEVADLLQSGKTILYSISIPEGLTVKQVFDRLAADEDLSGDLPAKLPPEGSLMPETYKFSRGTSREEIIQQMEEGQSALIDSIWLKRDADLPIKDKNEFVTLASIVEKETGIADERPRVAAVFINRLRKGMRLQSDPTVIYGIYGGDGKPSDKPIYKSDLEKDTPYNTYVIKGLPPGPIANPGRASLEAVANPARTEDIYFVADGSGGHAFAATLKEHNSNVAKWRKLEADKQQN
ncbi:endolytic transglycosylase MltG [Martelella alba]|uniref:Endolytic murein transglycosylase n=1 Tax=Martelella alba TaxID=2590451 RepID=A0A506UJ94_9HYPH|nr:endolytic transglycosylase MltG [Martelella alba]TPW33401.1 endolytic transglycosylase MltG [Martelella alba]